MLPCLEDAEDLVHAAGVAPLLHEQQVQLLQLRQHAVVRARHVALRRARVLRARRARVRAPPPQLRVVQHQPGLGTEVGLANLLQERHLLAEILLLF